MRKLSYLMVLAASVVMPALHAEEPVRGGSLVMAIQTTPRHLNPAVQSGIATGVPGAQLFAAPLR